MKVLYLSPAGHLGGAERALLDLIASIRNAEPDWELALIAAEDGDLVAEAGELGVATLVMPFPAALAAAGDAAAGGPAGNHCGVWAVMARLGAASPAVAMYVRRLSRSISDMAPDLAHTNGFKMHVLGSWTVPRRVPLVWHIHDFVRARPINSRLLKLHSQRCAAVIANSHSVADDARAALGAGMVINTVHNGVDLHQFSPEGSTVDLDALSGLPPASGGVLRVGLVATMARWKGHETFLRALSLLPREIAVRGYVIGGPIYQTLGSQHTIEELRDLAAQFGLADRIGFTGFVPDPAAAMRALDIVVHASVSPEPFGLVIAQAMACGKALVVSAAGGAREIILDGETALAHSPGDTAKLARCIASLLEDPALRARLGRASRLIAEQRFDRALLAPKLISIYRGLVSTAA